MKEVQDMKEIIQTYEKAAELGNAAAQYNLALLFLDGYGTKEDIKKVIPLFKKAAISGYVDAKYNLGICYYNGLFKKFVY